MYMIEPRKVSPQRGEGRRTAQTHRDLLARFPDLVRLTDLLDGVPYDTVYSWKRRDSIPPEYWGGVARAARTLGIRGVSVAALLRIADARRAGR